MLDLAQISGGLRRGEQGIWEPLAGDPTHQLSFPTGGHAECLQIEDGSFWFRHRNACLLEIVRRFPPAGAIFELGAGNGFVAAAFEQAGFPCVAVEPGVEGAHNARSRGVQTVVCSTLEAASFRPGSLPAVGLFDVVEHIEQDGPFLTEVVRALAPGGHLYVTVPAYRWLWSDEDRIAGHHRRYTLGRIRGDLVRAGLAVEYATYFFMPLVLPVFLMRTIAGRLRRSGGEPASHAVQQHRPAAGGLTAAITAALGLELRWLRRGNRVPIGTSCLLVARKPDAARG
jgi:SAM-dependent methyltransferase